MKICDGLLTSATYIASPHCDERSDAKDISVLVIHNISLPAGEFGTDHVTQLFTGTLSVDAHPSYHDLKGLRVSAHCFIRRTGEVIQYVPFQRRAWHAGVSVFQGRTGCNDFSIGIEMEGTDNQPYTESQYQALTLVTQAIMAEYPSITLGRIIGHCDIAPVRKTDPGVAFDWPGYRQRLGCFKRDA